MHPPGSVNNGVLMGLTISSPEQLCPCVAVAIQYICSICWDLTMASNLSSNSMQELLQYCFKQEFRLLEPPALLPVPLHPCCADSLHSIMKNYLQVFTHPLGSPSMGCTQYKVHGNVAIILILLMHKSATKVPQWFTVLQWLFHSFPSRQLQIPIFTHNQLSVYTKEILKLHHRHV